MDNQTIAHRNQKQQPIDTVSRRNNVKDNCFDARGSPAAAAAVVATAAMMTAAMAIPVMLAMTTTDSSLLLAVASDSKRKPYLTDVSLVIVNGTRGTQLHNQCHVAMQMEKRFYRPPFGQPPFRVIGNNMP